MLKQAIKIINLLTKSDKNLVKLIRKNKKVKWTKKIRKLKDLNKFYEIDVKSSKSELDKKIRATNTRNFKPYIKINNHKFVYSDS